MRVIFGFQELSLSRTCSLFVPHLGLFCFRSVGLSRSFRYSDIRNWAPNCDVVSSRVRRGARDSAEASSRPLVSF